MLDAALNLQAGQRLDRFLLVRLLGQGGVGQVWEVRDSSQRDKSKAYALKVVQYHRAAGDFEIAKLTREGLLLEKIKHANIVEVHDTGIIRELRIVWILMELLEGRTLRWLMRRGPLSPALMCSYLRQAAYGTEQCHLLGAAHRDLKPENMFLALSARRTLSLLKLLDFGLAKFLYGQDTQEGQRQGTPLYMAPEQIEGKKATPAIDVYALGVTAYEALWGENPFNGDGTERDPFLIFHRHLCLMPTPLWELGKPKEISLVIQKAISKRPEDRYPNGGALAEALLRAWKRDKETHPELDTASGEPTIEELEADSDGGRWFGTGPMAACPSEAISGEHLAQKRQPVFHAQTERLPREIPPAVAKAGFIPVAQTVRLPVAGAAALAARPEPRWQQSSEPPVESGFWPRRHDAVTEPVVAADAVRTPVTPFQPSSHAADGKAEEVIPEVASSRRDPAAASRPASAVWRAISRHASNYLLILAVGVIAGMWLSQPPAPPPSPYQGVTLPAPAQASPAQPSVEASSTAVPLPPVPAVAASTTPVSSVIPAASVGPAAQSVPAPQTAANEKTTAPRPPARVKPRRGGEVVDPWAQK